MDEKSKKNLVNLVGLAITLVMTNIFYRGASYTAWSQASLFLIVMSIAYFALTWGSKNRNKGFFRFYDFIVSLIGVIVGFLMQYTKELGMLLPGIYFLLHVLITVGWLRSEDFRWKIVGFFWGFGGLLILMYLISSI